MADTLLQRGRTDLGAIWVGAFTFAAVWLVFESLAVAILALASYALPALARSDAGGLTGREEQNRHAARRSKAAA